jgi:hypothetical protein
MNVPQKQFPPVHEVKVADIAIHLLDALENGERMLAERGAPLGVPVAGE